MLRIQNNSGEESFFENNSFGFNNDEDSNIQFGVFIDNEANQYVKKDPFFIIQKTKRRKSHDKNTSDNMYKKIKVKFLKWLKKTLNAGLKKAGSKKLFTFFPPKFSQDINKERNKNFFNSTLEEVLSIIASSNNEIDINEKRQSEINSLLDYLKQNITISINSGFENIKTKRMNELFEEYIQSEKIIFRPAQSIEKVEKEYLDKLSRKREKFIEWINK